MNITLINKVAVRSTASLAAFSMLLVSFGPLAAQAQTALSCTVVSDTSTQEGGADSFVVDRNPAWLELGDASYIWGDADNNAAGGAVQTFTKKFVVNGTPASAQLSVLADNGFSVKVNGGAVLTPDRSGVENNFATVNVYDITSLLVSNVNNVIDISVTNFVGSGDNPSGLAYKLEMSGSSCEPLPPPDVCENLEGDQSTVPAGYEANGLTCNPVTITTGTAPVQLCLNEDVLVQNGSFENPVISASYSVVATVVNWFSSTVDGFEIWRNLDGGAAAGEQNLELDVNTPSTVSQSIPTEIGNEYQVSFAFSPRVGTPAADNMVEVSFGGNVLGTVSADGTPYSANTWTYHNFVGAVTGTSTLLELRDLGTARDGYGTLVDDVSVCLVKVNLPEEEDTYEIFGFVWDDVNENDVKDTGEANLENWTVRAVNADNESDVVIDTTDALGRYSLNVPAGKWIISQLTETGWELLSSGDGVNSVGTYTVTVPGMVESPADAPLTAFINWLIPTAQAAAYAEVAGEFNFGNNKIEERDGGSSTGTRVGGRRSGSDRPGEVLGASTSTPSGVVLGDATTTMPVGAPNTGAGGTAPVNATLPSFVAILTTTTRKIK